MSAPEDPSHSALPVTTSGFPAEVLEASAVAPVLVDFWAPWCGPCRSLSPVLESIAREYAGRVRVCKVNTDEEPGLAAQFQIRGIPAVKLFRNGRVVDEFVGAQPLPAVREFLARHVAEAVPDEVAQAMAMAKQARYTECEAILNTLPPAQQFEPDVKAVRATAHFVRIASSPDESDVVQTARVRAARHLLAGELDAGLEMLFAAMNRNRRFAGSQGRDDVLRAFELCGSDDPRVAAGRRRLAALLN